MTAPAAGEPLYHLALAGNWKAAVEAGEYRVSGIGMTLEDEGFIHCSFAGQVRRTADKFYRGRADVLLLTIDPARLGPEVRAEDGFPHLYGPLAVDAVVGVRPLPLRPDGTLDTGM